MNKHRTGTAAKTLALAALLFSLTFAEQSYGAAPASEVDPTRWHSGAMVYPPGAMPPASDKAATKGKYPKGWKSTAVTIAPKGKPKPPAKAKSDGGD